MLPLLSMITRRSGAFVRILSVNIRMTPLPLHSRQVAHHALVAQQRLSHCTFSHSRRVTFDLTHTCCCSLELEQIGPFAITKSGTAKRRPFDAFRKPHSQYEWWISTTIAVAITSTTRPRSSTLAGVVFWS